ncbi:MAG: hypothetical protein JNL57_10750 [Bacteroidetes bacterium]|nr:hypothetical protein [Bacteroidota bacterium]
MTTPQNPTLKAILELCAFLDQRPETFTKEWIDDPHNSIGEFALCYDYADVNFKNKVVFGVYKIPLNLDNKKLLEAYRKLENRKLNHNFTQVKDQMMIVMEHKGLQILQHLEMYNGIADDYNAIAELINEIKVWPRIMSNKYGI